MRPGSAADDRPDPSARGRGPALGRRLRTLRTAAGLDPAELAHAARVDPAAYQRAEAGDPDVLTYLDLLALADALAVRPAAVLADLG